mmetsp:Transcript_32652/g.55040  ORF Transcript_32652/g.55040 Transcript_32652/m.55040 type:complete len:166 (+) Transcript_32652:79-576(+)
MSGGGKITQAFFRLPCFAVVGASNDRGKFGNKVLRCYKENNMKVIPVNKRQTTIEDLECVESLTMIAEKFDEYTTAFSVSNPASSATANSIISTKDVGVSIITPPGVTKMILEEGVSLGYRNFFLQPGTADDLVQEYIQQLQRQSEDIAIIQGCVLVELGFDESR